MKVAIVGAGIVGAATARALARRGAEVELLDAGEVSGGTTGLGEGNVLCSDKDAGPELELAVLGRAAYDELEATYGERARIRRKGALVVHRSEAGLGAEPARIERLRAAGVECELLEPAQARALEPALAPDLAAARPGCPATSSATRGRSRGRWRRSPASACAPTRGWTISARSAPTTSSSPPGRGAPRSRAAPGSSSRSSRARGSSCGSPGGSTSATRWSTGATSRPSRRPPPGCRSRPWSRPRTTAHVLVGSSRERRGFDTSVDAAVTARLLDAAARRRPRRRRAPPRGGVGGPAPVAARRAARARPLDHRDLGRHRPRGRGHRPRPGQRRAARGGAQR